MDAASSLNDARQPVVFGVYRDGDNNLDRVQARNVTDFTATTARDPFLKVIAEDTTSLAREPFERGDLRTESSIIEGGKQHVVRVSSAVDMSSRKTLASFVARTLEAKSRDPEFSHAPVWLDLVDHGGGDGGGLEADSRGGFMSMEDIAGSIADGRARFAAAHPGADDRITGVVANQCLMATLGFADALSRAGVRYLCASPETMLAPGVPSAKVADDLTHTDPKRWARSVVDDTMHVRYGTDGYHPAAAFDVFDLAPEKIANARQAIAAFSGAVEALPHGGAGHEAIRTLRADLASTKGMARFDHSADMPWHADRPAIAAFESVAGDKRLPSTVRVAADAASKAVAALVLAHGESERFGPFHASYADAAGPTIHIPTTKRSYDGWAENGVSETTNGFFDAVDGRGLARAIGSYNALEDRAAQSA